METKVLTAHVPLPLAEKIDRLAERLERSHGWIVEQALVAWVDQQEERLRLTSEAMADVDAGRVVDHQTVRAWADSLSTARPLLALLDATGRAAELADLTQEDIDQELAAWKAKRAMRRG